MILRPRQKEFVGRCKTALDERGNTLGVAPTGAGKTIMLSGVVGAMAPEKAAILAHRDELTAQNTAKFRAVNPNISTSVVDANSKDWSGQATFAMVPTLSRKSNLDNMPALDLLVIDEAHHAIADTYQRIVDQARKLNDKVKVFGVTATPNRGDKRGLRKIFDNAADQITIAELIKSGHLVPPKTFVVDVGTQDALRSVRKTASDYDMGEVDAIMNQAPITEKVIEHWQEKAGDRQTVVFCSTVSHAKNVTKAFMDIGITAATIWGDMPKDERRQTLDLYDKRVIQVLCNVAVLTEGWDNQPTSCIVLLRPSSYKSTMIQMIGRGLRTVDAELYPGFTKTDCIVLDFGTSVLLHGNIEQDINLAGKDVEAGDFDAPTKECPECYAEVPIAVRECPICGHEFETELAPAALVDFDMAEVDILARSNFRWVDLFGDGMAFIATGFNAWGGFFSLDGETWSAIGGGQGRRAKLLGRGEKRTCMAQASDWMNQYETEDAAHKTRRWLKQSATPNQLKYLTAGQRQNYGLDRYHASTLLTFNFNKQAIQRLAM
jgi:DNA repair protein RadD